MKYINNKKLKYIDIEINNITKQGNIFINGVRYYISLYTKKYYLYGLKIEGKDVEINSEIDAEIIVSFSDIRNRNEEQVAYDIERNLIIENKISYKFKKGNLKLVVNFPSMNTGNVKFPLWEFKSIINSEYSVLSFQDDGSYLGNYNIFDENGKIIDKDYIKIIKDKMDELEISEEDIILFGSSKGGTSALYYFQFFPKAKCISCVPQFDVRTFMDLFYPIYKFSNINLNVEANIISYIEQKLDLHIICCDYDLPLFETFYNKIFNKTNSLYMIRGKEHGDVFTEVDILLHALINSNFIKNEKPSKFIVPGVEPLDFIKVVEEFGQNFYTKSINLRNDKFINKNCLNYRTETIKVSTYNKQQYYVEYFKVCDKNIVKIEETEFTNLTQNNMFNVTINGIPEKVITNRIQNSEKNVLIINEIYPSPNQIVRLKKIFNVKTENSKLGKEKIASSVEEIGSFFIALGFQEKFEILRKNLTETNISIEFLKNELNALCGDANAFNEFNFREFIAESYHTNKLIIDILIDRLSNANLEKILEYNKLNTFISTLNELKDYITSFSKHEYIFSTIMTSYNRPDRIFKTIDSFIKASYKSELIIVDNNSAANLVKKIEEYISGISNIRLVKSKENLFCGGRNLGLDLAKGEYITFVDDDDILSTDYYKVLYEKVSKFRYDAIRFNPIHFDIDGHFHPSISYLIMKNEHISNLILKDSNYILENIRDNFASSCFVCFRRDLINDIRFLEKIILEDTAFYFNLIYRFNSIAYISDAIYYREIAENTMIKTKDDPKNKKLLDISLNAIIVEMFINANKYKITNYAPIMFWINYNLGKGENQFLRVKNLSRITEYNFKEMIKNEEVKDIIMQRYK